jgi:hypothetical protein
MHFAHELKKNDLNDDGHPAVKPPEVNAHLTKVEQFPPVRLRAFGYSFVNVNLYLCPIDTPRGKIVVCGGCGMRLYEHIFRSFGSKRIDIPQAGSREFGNR